MEWYQPVPHRYRDPDSFFKDIESHMEFKYSEVVADAKYESEENYLFIKDNG